MAEFGKSFKGSSSYERDEVFNSVYYKIYASAKRGGAASGALFWQLLTEGMESFQDGYGIILGQSSSTANLIARQSRKLYLIRKIFARVANMRRWQRARARGGNGGRYIGNWVHIWFCRYNRSGNLFLRLFCFLCLNIFNCKCIRITYFTRLYTVKACLCWGDRHLLYTSLSTECCLEGDGGWPTGANRRPWRWIIMFSYNYYVFVVSASLFFLFIQS